MYGQQTVLAAVENASRLGDATPYVDCCRMNNAFFAGGVRDRAFCMAPPVAKHLAWPDSPLSASTPRKNWHNAATGPIDALPRRHPSRATDPRPAPIVT
ncbi:hypothetical protein GCM10022419_101260 [Nonomuraea rosea]|uniref:Uncharacterized protein n=1 Tax=Nonomuraea rosea TaxID=638574 RepID=A0ABP6Z8Y8_9ACTN